MGSRLLIHFSSQEVHFNKMRPLVAGTNKGSGPKRQAGQVNIHPALTANIFWQPLTQLTFTTRQMLHNITRSI
jgi:hypothetical protein